MSTFTCIVSVHVLYCIILYSARAKCDMIELETELFRYSIVCCSHSICPSLAEQIAVCILMQCKRASFEYYYIIVRII